MAVYMTEQVVEFLWSEAAPAFEPPLKRWTALWKVRGLGSAGSGPAPRPVPSKEG